MLRSENWSRSLALLLLSTCTSIFAHYPHDNQNFVTLSPNFSTDGTLFISSRQGWSTRSEVALRSQDSGLSWQPTPEGLDNTAIFLSGVVSPQFETDNTVLLISRGSGVFRSTDAGTTWQGANQGLPSLELYLSETTVTNNDVVISIISGVRGGLFRSSNFGNSWETVLNTDTHISALAISPNYANDQLMMVGTPSGELMLSMNGGIKWFSIGTIPTAGEITQIAFAPDFSTNGGLYIGTEIGLFFRNNANPSLQKIETFVADRVSALAISPSFESDATLFATTPTDGIFKSTNGGATWETHSTGHPFSSQSSSHFFNLEISDNFATDNTLFLGAFEGLYRSTDGGLTWEELETRPPSLITGIGMSPNFANDGLIAVSNYGGGLMVSNDHGETWGSSNVGLSGLYTYDAKIAFDATETPVLISSFTNNLLISANQGDSWTMKSIVNDAIPSCVESAIDISAEYSIDPTVLIGCRKDGVVITRDGGETWQIILPREMLRDTSLTAVKLSPNFSSDQTVFVATDQGHVLRTQDAGANWESILTGLPAPGYRYGSTSFAISPNFANDQAILIGTPKGLFGSVNQGNQWFQMPTSAGPVATGVIEHVAISPDFSTDLTIIVSIRGLGLFRSINAGAHWEQVGAGLLNQGYQLNDFEFSPTFSSDSVIIGFSHDRLLRSTDRGNTFQLFDIPFVRHEDSREQSVRYEGSGWNKVRVLDASASSIAATAIAGDEVHLGFWGTGVTWVGYKAEMLGLAAVYLNDSLITTIDQYSETLQGNQVHFSISNLSEGWHKLHIIATNQRNPKASANALIIDAFDVTR